MADQKKVFKARGIKRTDMSWEDPDKLIIVSDDKSGFCHASRNAAPLVEALVLNILLRGVIEPVVVRMNGEDIEVIDGRRRVLHAREANRRLREAGGDLIRVPFIVRGGSEVDLLGIASSAQMHEEESPYEKACHLDRLMSRGKSIEEASIDVGVSVHRAKELLVILTTSDVVQKAVEEKVIPASAVKHLSKLPHEEQEKRVKELVEGAKEKKTKGEKKPRKATAADAREAAGLIVAPAKRRLASLAKIMESVAPKKALLLWWFLGRMTDRQIAQEDTDMRAAMTALSKKTDKE